MIQQLDDRVLRQTFRGQETQLQVLVALGASDHPLTLPAIVRRYNAYRASQGWPPVRTTTLTVTLTRLLERGFVRRSGQRRLYTYELAARADGDYLRYLPPFYGEILAILWRGGAQGCAAVQAALAEIGVVWARTTVSTYLSRIRAVGLIAGERGRYQAVDRTWLNAAIQHALEDGGDGRTAAGVAAVIQRRYEAYEALCAERQQFAAAAQHMQQHASRRGLPALNAAAQALAAAADRWQALVADGADDPWHLLAVGADVHAQQRLVGALSTPQDAQLLVMGLSLLIGVPDAQLRQYVAAEPSAWVIEAVVGGGGEVQLRDRQSGRWVGRLRADLAERADLCVSALRCYQRAHRQGRDGAR